MKILFLTQLLPCPADTGGKIKTLAILKMLKKLKCQIFLACFVDKKRDLKYKNKLQNICHQTRVFYQPVITKIHKKLLLKALLSLFSPKPFAVIKYYKKEMKEFLGKIIPKENFDIIYIDHLHLIQYLNEFSFKKNKPLLVYDEHNIYSLVSWRNFKITKNLIGKFSYLLEAIKWYIYEKKYLPIFDKIFAISKLDKSRLVKFDISPEKIQFLPFPMVPNLLYKFKPDNKRILFIGLLSWEPNKEGFWWFYQKVFLKIKKIIPDVEFVVIGAYPSKNMLKAAVKDKNLKILGYVQDINNYFENAAVFVVPIRSGGGIRVKILDALSKGMPVVSTTLGSEGIRVRNKKEIIIADKPDKFAQAVIKIIKNKRTAEQLSNNGLKFIQSGYNKERTREVLARF